MRPGSNPRGDRILQIASADILVVVTQGSGRYALTRMHAHSAWVKNKYKDMGAWT